MKLNHANPDENDPEPAPRFHSLTLLERLRTNAPDGWRRLVHLYGPLVYRWCRRRRLQEDDAADVAQEVFRTVSARIGSFRRDRTGDTFRGWLWTITRYKIGDHIRRLQRQPGGRGGSDAYQNLQELPDQLPTDADSVADSRSLVHRALEMLRGEFKEVTWQMFWRAAVMGHAPKDIAADMGVTPDAVRMAKSRVLRRLREELPDWEDWGSGRG